MRGVITTHNEKKHLAYHLTHYYVRDRFTDNKVSVMWIFLLFLSEYIMNSLKRIHVIYIIGNILFHSG